jgi:hypothetical protein
MKKALIPCLVLLLAAASWAAPQTIPRDAAQREYQHQEAAGPAEQKPHAQMSPQAGSAILDAYIDTLSGMARQGAPDSLDKSLGELMLAAKKAREAGQVDSVFFSRFNRLLAVTKLVAVPDPSGVLVPVIEDVLGTFVQDKLGHDEFRGAKGAKAISHVAQALSTELINLQIYLDTTKERESLQFKIQERMSGGPKK